MGAEGLIKKIVEKVGVLRGQVAVIRLSSKVIEDSKLLDQFADNIKTLADCGIKVYIIHDYTNLLASTIDRLQPTSDQNISHLNDDKTIELAEMILSGHVNKQVVSILCRKGLQAIGLSGKDGNLVTAKHSKKLLTLNGAREHRLYVNDPLLIIPEILFELEDTNIITIISPIAFNEKGKTCILNIDTTSSMLASTIDAQHLIILCKLKNNIKPFISISDKEILNELEIYNGLKFSIDKSLIRAAEYTMTHSSSSVHFINEEIKDSMLTALFCQ